MTWREKLHQVIDGLELGDMETPAAMAEVFCEWDDEKQAQFFIEVARVMGTWKPGASAMQASSIGRHLRICACSNDDARGWVGQVAYSAGRRSA